MRFNPIGVRLCGLVVVGAMCGVVAHGQKIPETHAKTLAGNVANLPADLHGKLGVLVLGFSKKSSDECHGWDDQISRDFGGSARIVYYEMPVLEDVPGMIRGMVVRGIRNGLTPAARARFLPVLQDEAAWKAAAQFGPADDAYVLIVDETGAVKWRTHGPVTTASYAAFKSNLMAIEK
ncbi:MAG TPA: hypothetical protein VGD64_05655 [Acidisarcina sp.]